MLKSNQKARRKFSSEFKSQLVQLYKNGKRKVDIQREYDIGSSLLDRWIHQYDQSVHLQKRQIEVT